MRSHILLVCLALVFCLHLTTAIRYPVLVRQDDSPPDESTRAPATTDGEARRPSPTESPSRESSAVNTRSNDSTASRGVPASSSTSVTPTVDNQIPATASSNGPLPTTATEADSKNPLPIHPKITPAMGLSGAILLISGLVYTVIGIKNRWLYIFLSAAYLTSLAVTVLIVYLMSPPVSDAVQGAFFVAAFFTGAIFGGLSLVFTDITDGLGCLLGGFCLSMWFLTLKEGGLIQSTTGRAIFIGCMSAAGFSLSFSHYTRNYGLIASISFSGATVTMLGVDCFSRAGWKEFWLYLWDLNPDTFPLHTNTYPVTRYIKAEVAGVVLLSIMGIISQLRLWRLVKERRENNATLRLEREEHRDREEEELGRQIEDNFAKDRARWEATYGDKTLQDSAVEPSMESTPKTSISVREHKDTPGDDLEMVPITKAGVAQSPNKHASTGPMVTVTVLDDDGIQEIDAQGNPIESKEGGPSALQSDMSKENSIRASAEVTSSEGVTQSVSTRSSLRSSVPPPPPIVVPLPFKIPTEEDTQSQDGDNTSVSAVPESNHESVSNRRSLSKRISGLSGMKRFSSSRLSREISDSEEALIIPHIEDDRASSVAATLDDANDDFSLSDVSLPTPPVDSYFQKQPLHPSYSGVTDNAPDGREGQFGDREAKQYDDISETVPDNSEPSSARVGERQSLTISTDPRIPDSKMNRGSLNSPRQPSSNIMSITEEESERGHQSKSTKSGTPSVSSRTAESHVGNLTQALPARFSKVALSYRTNEWAKHLEAADKPGLDDIREPESPGVKLAHGFEEPPAPVSQEIAQPLLKTKRDSKRRSTESNAYRKSIMMRSSSNQSRRSQVEPVQSLSRTPSVLPAGGVSKSNSRSQSRAKRSSSTPYLPVEETRRSALSPSPTPGNTLMDKRESLVRNKVSTLSFSPHSSSGNLVVSSEQENMTLAQRKRILQHQGPPSASQQRRQSGRMAVDETQGFNSHQPKRVSSSGSVQKREVLLAGWREAIREDAKPTVIPEENTRRAVMMNDIQQKEQEKQQRKMETQRRESMLDMKMRTGGMLDAHRDAMRRMQADANKKA
ncbi:hypothetical protein BDV95DRAFT_631697 [Massariosphaeria phaeospora]|uniref:TM7S3/TM198-like domain-containing protein n=1 Tax=Massariosphaeria phaeospora TaxID=100035 RepID=A0A7C8M8H0_9PLEO|nr:hypothetical protein BDV95DRAFT_631697 [Massariosphaeria phaeospora]